MEHARCIEDGAVYSAANFAQQLPEELDRKRRLLQCPECGGPAFFRNASFNGVRIACFGARPHADGCGLAAYDCMRMINGDEHESLNIRGEKIIVDFNYGVATHPATDYRTGCENFSTDWEGCRSNAETHRRMRPLLRHLMESPTFKNSEQIIEVLDQQPMPARDFFVPILSVHEQHIGLCRGYWGLLSTVRIADDGQSLWFNSGGKDNVSFRLDIKFLPYFTDRYRVRDEEDFAGAYILVIGILKSAPQKRFYCEIVDMEFMALRLT